jgi:hypothetical protein
LLDDAMFDSLTSMFLKNFMQWFFAMQTGVAQKHYNSERKARERMPGRFDGQIYSYPQRR